MHPLNKSYHYSIPELFETEVKKNPNHIALQDNNIIYTYISLNEKVNQIAQCLLKKSIHHGNVVAILLEPSADFIICMLAILKIGAMYLPIDTIAPKNRLKEIIDDAAPKLIITNEVFQTKLEHIEYEVCLIKHVNLESVSYPKDNLNLSISPNASMYMMYTSGSTGRPKGVIIPHCAVVNLVKVGNYANIKQGEIIAQFSNLAFDGSTFEIWSALLNGATLSIIPLTARTNHIELTQTLKNNSIEYIFLPTGFFHQLIKSNSQALDSVRVIVFGGEQVNKNLLKHFLNHRKHHQLPLILINGYGPTEATAFSCKHIMNENSNLSDDQLMSIGDVISNVKTYILDENYNECREGELYISGINLALGYHNSVQNQEKFIPNPFDSHAPYERLYKTGDKVRKLPSGELSCLGRLDDQVKIGGFRIHLNEIEQTLIKHPGIALAAVNVELGGGLHKILTAYLVMTSKLNTIHADDIRTFLSQTLPSYMLPAKYVMVDELSLTNVGKVDKKNLDKIPHTDLSFHIDTSSSSSIEETIKNVWRHLLNRKSIETHKNLFDLGANSLLITEACSMLNKELECELQISDMLTHPTIHKLSRYLEGDIETPLTRKKLAHQSSDIAIIGMSCRLPKANNIDEFWNNLCQGQDCLTRFEPEQFKNDDTLNQNFVPVRGILSDVEQFDASFFGFSPVDASITDPQQRLFLECVWEALEHASVAPVKDSSKIISLFAGMTDSTYLHENLLKNHWFCNEHDHFQQRIATSVGMLSTQVSYRLNLKGRSVNVNTACSTGLMTVDQACQDLMIGQSDIALAGASSIIVPQINGYTYQQGSIVSPDGYCRPFSANANGTVFSNGVGVVVLKRLADAIQDNNTIYAVIKSSSVNNDGADKLGFTAPSLNGQMSCVREALAQACVSAKDIEFIETHGTATALGDIIEINALTSVYREHTEQQQYCALGSVKGNIGHTDVTAGIAGLIKTALCLHHKKIPPLIHFEAPNPNLMLDKSPFFINSELIDWETTAANRYAGVSAFGVGGTNIHMILSDYAKNESEIEYQATEELLLFSAKTENALKIKIQHFYEYMRTQNSSNNHWANAAYTLQTGREDFQWRQFLVSQSLIEFQSELERKKPKCVDENIHHSIVFMFSGQGTQYPQMAMELFNRFPIFQEHVKKGAALAKPYLNCDLLDLICNPDNDQLTQTEYAQPALFIIEYALAHLLMDCNIKPEAFIGHSIGEYVAACLAGVFSFEDGIALVCERGLLMAKAVKGEMLALECTEDELQKFQDIASVEVALHNATHHYVLAGSLYEIAQIEQHLTMIGKPFHRLKVSHAFHSQLMASLEKSFKEIFSNITLSPPLIPIVSNVTGDWLSTHEALDPDYWYRHLRHTVQFSKGIKLLLCDQHPLFVEVGLGQSLCGFVKEISGGKANVTHTLPSHHQSTSDLFQLQTCLGDLWSHGIAVKTHRLFDTVKRQHIQLPTYPFQKQRYWIEPDLKINSVNLRCFRPVWIHHKINYHFEFSKNLLAKHTWIIIKDQFNFADNFINFLKNYGINCINIYFGETYLNDDSSSFTINSNKMTHYRKFINTIKNNIQNPIFLNFSSFGATANTAVSEVSMEKQFQYGFYNLLYLSQALIEEINEQQPLKIAVVTSGTQKIIGTESINPLNATLVSACRVIMQEHPTIKFKLFDLNPEETLDKNIINKIMDSCINNKWQEFRFLQAYRNKYQWDLTYNELALNKNTFNRLKDDGVYLLTGGLGGIALSCCEAISQAVSEPVFILLSRTLVPQESEWDEICKDPHHSHNEKIQRILKLRSLGAKIHIHQINITDLDSLKILVQQSIKNFGKINGLIHTAGISMPALMQLKTMASTREVFAPKVLGTFNLIKAFKNISLDFVVLKSSLSSLLGGFEQIDYSAANSFLDAVSSSDLFSNAAFVLSINWNTWREVGIAARNNKEGKSSFIGKGDNISTDEGKKLFLAILKGEATQVAVSKLDINNIQTTSVSNPLKSIQNISREQLSISTRYIAPSNDVELMLIQLWQETLGIDKLGITDDFFSLGGHSLLALNLIEKINKSLNCSLPMTQIYRTPTIQQLNITISGIPKRKKNPIIVSLKKAEERAPSLFLCHPVSGLVNCFNSFAEQSDLPMSIYGLQDPSIETNTIIYKSFASIVDDYLSAIKKIQSKGPYFLIGYSFGGVICYEIANKLQQQGETIGLLSLIDSWTINPLPFQNESFFKDHFKSQNKALPDSIINLAWERELLFFKHTISKSNQKMLLFKATGMSNDFKSYNTSTNGWENYNKGEIICHSINGTHETILSPSNCTSMLYLIQEYLNESIG